MATLGDQGEPHPGDVEGLLADQLDAVHLDPSRARRRQAHQAPDQGGLAHPVASEQRHAGRVGHAQGHALEDVVLAAIGVHVLDLQHQRPPRAEPPEPR